MAAFNFPNSPSTNDLHTENSVTWKWNGTVWKRINNSYLTASTLNISGISTFVGNAQFSTLSGSGALVYSTGSGVLDDSVNHTISGNTLNTVDIEAQGNITVADKIIHRSDTNTSIRFPSNDTITAETAGNERLRITSTGLFGIGVTPISIFHVRPLDETNFLVRNEGSTVVLASETNNGRDSNRGMALEATQFEFIEGGSEKVRIDGSGRVLIGSTAKAGDSALQVYTADRKHPAIRTNSPNANGYTLLADAYTADESQVNIGVSYSSSSLVLGFGCKVSDSADNAYLSTQDTYSTRPCVLRIGTEGSLSFWTTETNSTRTTDSAASLTEVFSIDRVGNIRQKISSRYMYFGASQQFEVGVNGSDPMLNAAGGDLQIKNSGTTIAVARGDHLQMYQHIKMNDGKGIDFSATSDGAGTDSSELFDDYEEGSWTPVLAFANYSVGTQSNSGTYVKIGNMCHCEFTIHVNSSQITGSPSSGGWVRINGIPYNSSSSAGYQYLGNPAACGKLKQYVGQNGSNDFNKIFFYMPGNSSYMALGANKDPQTSIGTDYLYGLSEETWAGAVNDSSNHNTEMRASFSYRTI